MSYDPEPGAPSLPPAPQPTKPPADSRDLETLEFLLDVAGLSLSSDPDSSFTREELFAEARRYGGPELKLRDVDMAIVLPFLFKRVCGGRWRLKF